MVLFQNFCSAESISTCIVINVCMIESDDPKKEALPTSHGNHENKTQTINCFNTNIFNVFDQVCLISIETL